MSTPLRTVRERRGLTMKQAAKDCEMDVSHYRRVELGEAGASAAVARRIAKYFGHEVTEMQILYPQDYVTPEETKE